MFIFTNPHPQGKCAGDCVKRACVLASGINYHDIAIMLNRYKKISGGSKFNSNENWKEFVEEVLCGIKNVEDMRYINYGQRHTVDSFTDQFCSGKYILRCSKHLVAVIDGDYLDTWDSGYKGVYIAYQIPSYKLIVDHIRKCYPKLCKGLTLEASTYEA